MPFGAVSDLDAGPGLYISSTDRPTHPLLGFFTSRFANDLSLLYWFFWL